MFALITLVAFIALVALVAFIALVALVALIAFVTFLALDAVLAVDTDGAIVGFLSILIPVAVGSDGPGCAGSTVLAVNTVLTIGESVGFSIAESDVDTVSSGCYIRDDGATLDELLEFSKAYVDSIDLGLQILDVIIVVRTGGEAE